MRETVVVGGHGALGGRLQLGGARGHEVRGDLGGAALDRGAVPEALVGHSTCFPSFPELCAPRAPRRSRGPSPLLLTGSRPWGMTEEAGESVEWGRGVHRWAPFLWDAPLWLLLGAPSSPVAVPSPWHCHAAVTLCCSPRGTVLTCPCHSLKASHRYAQQPLVTQPPFITLSVWLPSRTPPGRPVGEKVKDAGVQTNRRRG